MKRWVWIIGLLLLFLCVLPALFLGAQVGSCGSSSVNAPGSLKPADLVRYLSSAVPMSVIAASGVVGNLEQESSLNPAAAGGGLAQWIHDRWTALLAFTAAHGLDPSSADGQLAYLVNDLKTAYAGLAQEMNRASTPGQAAVMFMNVYEVCDPASCDTPHRVEFATLAATGTSGGSGIPIATITPGIACAGATAPTIPGAVAKINPDGTASIPAGAPRAVQLALEAGNRLIHSPYPHPDVHYGDMSTMWPAWDCSGSVSYVLYGGGLHSSTADVSGSLESWGVSGPGQWITVWANPGHTFVEVAGIVMNTAWYAPVQPTTPSSGPRWQPASTIPAQIHGDSLGWFVQRHPAAL